MIRRSSDLIGKPVVLADSGEKLGTVADLLVDDEGRQFVGLVLRHGPFKSENVLPAEAVQALGGDAVVTRSRDLISPKEWRARQQGFHADDRMPVVPTEEPPNG